MTKRKRSRASGAGRAVHRDAFPALRSFLRGYLHQDFTESHGSVRAAAAAFSADANAEERSRLAADIERLSAAMRDKPESEFQQFIVDELGSAWHIRSRAELVDLLDVIRPPADTSPSAKP